MVPTSSGKGKRPSSSNCLGPRSPRGRGSEEGAEAETVFGAEAEAARVAEVETAFGAKAEVARLAEAETALAQRLVSVLGPLRSSMKVSVLACSRRKPRTKGK